MKSLRFGKLKFSYKAKRAGAITSSWPLQYKSFYSENIQLHQSLRIVIDLLSHSEGGYKVLVKARLKIFYE